MKKFITVLLAVLLAVGCVAAFTACGGSDDDLDKLTIPGKYVFTSESNVNWNYEEESAPFKSKVDIKIELKDDYTGTISATLKVQDTNFDVDFRQVEELNMNIKYTVSGTGWDTRVAVKNAATDADIATFKFAATGTNNGVPTFQHASLRLEMDELDPLLKDAFGWADSLPSGFNLENMYIYIAFSLHQ